MITGWKIECKHPKISFAERNRSTGIRNKFPWVCNVTVGSPISAPGGLPVGVAVSVSVGLPVDVPVRGHHRESFRGPFREPIRDLGRDPVAIRLRTGFVPVGVPAVYRLRTGPCPF